MNAPPERMTSFVANARFVVPLSLALYLGSAEYKLFPERYSTPTASGNSPSVSNKIFVARDSKLKFSLLVLFKAISIAFLALTRLPFGVL